MTAIDVEAIEHIRLVQGISITIGTADGFRGNNLTANLTAVGLHELSHIAGRPIATCIGRCPVGLVLNRDGIQLYAVLTQVLNIFLQVGSIVWPVFFLQRAYLAGIVLGID